MSESILSMFAAAAVAPWAAFWWWACSALATRKGRGFKVWAAVGAVLGPIVFIPLLLVPAKAEA